MRDAVVHATQRVGGHGCWSTDVPVSTESPGRWRIMSLTRILRELRQMLWTSLACLGCCCKAAAHLKGKATNGKLEEGARWDWRYELCPSKIFGSEMIVYIIYNRVFKKIRYEVVKVDLHSVEWRLLTLAGESCQSCEWVDREKSSKRRHLGFGDQAAMKRSQWWKVERILARQRIMRQTVTYSFSVVTVCFYMWNDCVWIIVETVVGPTFSVCQQ